MRKSTIIKVAAVAVLGAVPLVAAGSTAQAGGAVDDYYFKTTHAQWLERGASPLVGGNVHRGVVYGFLDVYGQQPNPDAPATPKLSGRIEGWQCPTGVQPPKLFAGGQSGATPCRPTGVRDLSFPRAGEVTLAPRLVSGHVHGIAVAIDPTGARGPVRVPVDLALTGTGSIETSVNVQTWTEDGVQVTNRTTYRNRDADVRGKVGADVVGDERSDLTYGTLSTQRAEFTRQ